jgi:hypothetical protein
MEFVRSGTSFSRRFRPIEQLDDPPGNKSADIGSLPE